MSTYGSESRGSLGRHEPAPGAAPAKKIKRGIVRELLELTTFYTRIKLSGDNLREPGSPVGDLSAGHPSADPFEMTSTGEVKKRAFSCLFLNVAPPLLPDVQNLIQMSKNTTPQNRPRR